MLYVHNEGTPLPPRAANIPLEKLYVKLAFGVALLDPEGSVYMILMERDDEPDGVIRFLGGTAVPAPYSMVSPMLQSANRIATYFGEPLVLTQEAFNDYIPLHTLLVSKVRMHDGNPGKQHDAVGFPPDGGALHHEAPDLEVHGLLPVSAEFVTTFRSKLERVWLNENGKVTAESGRKFNNTGIIQILRHLLRQVGEGTSTILNECNPAWDNGDYTPCHDA